MQVIDSFGVLLLIEILSKMVLYEINILCQLSQQLSTCMHEKLLTNFVINEHITEKI